MKKFLTGLVMALGLALMAPTPTPQPRTDIWNGHLKTDLNAEGHAIIGLGLTAGAITGRFQDSNMPLGTQLFDNQGSPKLSLDVGARKAYAADGTSVAFEWNTGPQLRGVQFARGIEFSNSSYIGGGGDAVLNGLSLRNQAGPGTVSIDTSPLTGNQIISTPDQSGILLLDTATQEVRNKTINGSFNTIINIPPTSLQGYDTSTWNVTVPIGVDGLYAWDDTAQKVQVWTLGAGLQWSGSSPTKTLALANTAVTPASYTSANITVDQQGRITAASNGSSGFSFSAANKLLGRGTSGAGAAQEISIGTALDMSTTTLILKDMDHGEISTTSDGTIWTVDANSITNGKLAQMAANTFKGNNTGSTANAVDMTVAQAKTLLNLTGTNSGDQTITLTGDVTGAGTGSFAATVANDAITYAKMQNVSATSRFLGRITAGAGDPEELTAANGWTILGVMPAANEPPHTGDVTNSSGSLAMTIANSAVTYAKMQNVSANSKLLGSSASGSGAAPSEITLGTNLSMSGSTLNATSAGETTDGWIDPSETWTYASATTFTVAADVTTKYSKGDKIKLTQTTVKYFYIVGVSSFSGGNTTLTITGGSDYTLANAAISANYFSKKTSPNGFPAWFTWAPTFTGFSSAPTGIMRFSMTAATCHVIIFANSGTSNATGFTFTLPVTASANTLVDVMVRARDSGTFVGNAMLEVGQSSTTAAVTKDAAGTAFTASGTKAVMGEFFYEY